MGITTTESAVRNTPGPIGPGVFSSMRQCVGRRQAPRATKAGEAPAGSRGDFLRARCHASPLLLPCAHVLVACSSPTDAAEPSAVDSSGGIPPGYPVDLDVVGPLVL